MNEGGWDKYRAYLLVLARMNMSRQLAGKFDPSDIVQETLLQAHRAEQQFRGSTDEERAGWLRKILARNLGHAARDLHRQKRDVSREQSLEAAVHASSLCLGRLLPGPDSTPADRAVRNEQQLQLAAALESLPASQRDAILLKYWRGMSLSEMSAELNRSPQAVAGLLHRGLKALRDVLP